jgi:hypothetical protein
MGKNNDFYEYRYLLKNFNDIIDQGFLKFSMFKFIFNDQGNGKQFEDKKYYPGKELYMTGILTRCETDPEKSCIKVGEINHYRSDTLLDENWHEGFIPMRMGDCIEFLSFKVNLFPFIKEIEYMKSRCEHESFEPNYIHLVNLVKIGINFWKIITTLREKGDSVITTEWGKNGIEIRALQSFPMSFPISKDSLGKKNIELKNVEEHLCNLVGIPWE